MVIAARNEEAVLPALLHRLQAMDWPAAGWAEPAGLLLADGGSSDATPLLAAGAGCVVVREAGTRGAQWNAAVRQAPGEVLWFLHADTLPPPQAPGLIREALRPAGVVGGGFALRFEPDSPALRAVAWGSDLRARRWQVFFGDQAPFVRRPAFEAVGGYRTSLCWRTCCWGVGCAPWGDWPGSRNRSPHPPDASCGAASCARCC